VERKGGEGRRRLGDTERPSYIFFAVLNRPGKKGGGLKREGHHHGIGRMGSNVGVRGGGLKCAKDSSREGGGSEERGENETRLSLESSTHAVYLGEELFACGH